MLDKLSSEKTWMKFYRYKSSLAIPGKSAEELLEFIEDRSYIPVCEKIYSGEPFPLPRKAIISKASTQKKRSVYIYPEAESMVLKLLTYLLLREYDHIFSDGLYSFRPGRNAQNAFRKISSIHDIDKMYSYKVDVSDYFNSIDTARLVPMLEKTIEDEDLLKFLTDLLCEKRVYFDGKIITEEKGIMAGTPQASFFANLYLCDLDHYFTDKGIPYARYSDDIIVFAKTKEELEGYAKKIKDTLREKGLNVNPKKESYSEPGEKWVFLGFSYENGIIDIAPASIKKIKGKMRRKARALVRWEKRKNVDGEKAAKAFIRIFNRKLMECSDDSDLTWSYWFFSVINTTESLKVIDNYAQDCIRFIGTGTRKKARYNMRYEDMKELGYKTLVNTYYGFSDNEED